MSRTSSLRNIKDLDKTYRAIAKKNIVIISLFITFFIGMIYGTIMLSYSSPINNTITSLSKEFFNTRINQPAMQTFLLSIFSSIIFLIILYLLGLCAISHPIVFFTIFFKGLGIGITVTHLYSTYKLKGILFALIIIIIPSIISTISIIIAGKEALRLSTLFLSKIFPKIDGELSPTTFKFYNIKFIILLIFIIISSIIDLICSVLFSRFFQL